MYNSATGTFRLSRNCRRPACHLVAIFVSFTSALLSGCAALTNPVVDGLPVHRLPPELLAPIKNIEQTIPLTLLGQKKPTVYRLEPGDVLGLYIEGVLGDRAQPIPMHVAPPVQIANQRTQQPAVGYPVPVQENGTILLPEVEPLRVQGLSLAEVQAAIAKVYADKGILQKGQEHIFVTLLRPRTYQVLVLRKESASFLPGPEGLVATAKQGTGQVLDLPAYENDVLHALTLSGGLPGLDAYDAVTIERAGFQDDQERTALMQQFRTLPPCCSPLTAVHCGKPIIHIPLRLPPGQCPPIRPEDVLLHNGDVVFLEARDKDLFYTGGLLPAGEHILPRDHDLDVLEALTQVHGPLINGAFSTNNLAGNLINPGMGGPSPTLLVVIRRTPQGQVPIRVDLSRALKDPRERLIVRPGDLLILQEMPREALARYFTQTFFNFDVVWQAFHDRFATGLVNVAAPDRLPGLAPTVAIPQQ